MSGKPNPSLAYYNAAQHSMAIERKPHITGISRVVKEDAELIVAEMRESLKVLSGQKILVTGAAGFLGSYFLDVFAGEYRW